MQTNKLFAVAAMLPVLFSCAKEEIRTNENLSGDGQKYDFTITVSGDEDSITKASLSDDTGIFWVSGGNAGIVKKEGENTVRYESNALKIYTWEGYNQASFKFTETATGVYKFFYPYHKDATLDKIPFWVNPNQTTSAGSSADCFALVSNKMVGLDPNNYDTPAETTYKVVGSYIRFTVFGKADELLKSIIIKGADRTVSGRYFVNGNDNSLRTGETDLKGETITLTVDGDYKTTATNTDAKGLYVAVLPESSQNTYTVITDKGFYSFPSASAKEFKFGAIKDIPLNLSSSKAVRTPDALYVVGDATTAGWNENNAIPLIKDGNKYKIENIPLCIARDGFKFLTQQGNWENVFVNAGDNKTLAYYVGLPPEGMDTKFTVDKNGYYDLVVDFNTITVTTTFKTEFPKVISNNKANEYEMLPTGNEGEFKATAFIGSGDYNHDFYIYEGEKTYHESKYSEIASFDKGNNYTYTGEVTLDATTDKGWWIADGNYQTPRYYDITLNKNTNTITVKFAQGKNFWLIGHPFNDFKPEKWDTLKQTADENGIVTWEVTTTTTGDWKICGEHTCSDAFWKGEWYYSNADKNNTLFDWSWDGGNNYSDETEEKNFDVRVFCSDERDQKWQFNETGTFRITFDSKQLKIKVEKLYESKK